MNKENLDINEYLKETNNDVYNPSKKKSMKHKVTVAKKKRTKKLLSNKTEREKWTLKKIINLFDLEAGIDILDESEALYRKNRIIKRIVFITNILFSVFLITRNYTMIVVTILLFLFTFGINKLLKSLIYDDPTDALHQQIAMYLVSGNTLIVAIATFINLRIDAVHMIDIAETSSEKVAAFNEALVYSSISNVAYGLIFFSLVITAFYQKKTLMRHISYITLFLYTVIHTVIIYPTYKYISSASTFLEYSQSAEFRDISIRTVVLVIFLLAINFNVKISEKLNDERKKELVSRRHLEKDFLVVVEDIFNGIEVFNSSNMYKDKFTTYRSAQLVRKLAGLLKLHIDEVEGYADFAKIHIDKRDFLTLMDFKHVKVLSQRDYAEIEERTHIGREVLNRLRLNQLSEDLVRTHCHNGFERTFKESETISLDLRSQLILLTDLYDALRMDRLYKDEFSHRDAIRIIRDSFSKYFDFQVVDRFIRFESEFRDIYDNFIL